MIQLRTASAAAALLAGLASGATQAQVSRDVRPPSVDLNPQRYIGAIELPVFAAKKSGHDKCQGKGHEKGNGDGHEEGECDEDTTPPGPVESGVTGVIAPACDAGLAGESSWQRLVCSTAIEAAAGADGSAEYVQAYSTEASVSLNDYATVIARDFTSTVGDAATGLVTFPRPNPPPSPVVPQDIPQALALVNAVVDAQVAYSAEAINAGINVGERLVANVSGSVGDSATGLVTFPRPNPPPSPVVPDDLQAFFDYGSAVTAYSATYTSNLVARDLNIVAGGTTTVLGSVGDSATGLVTFPRPNPPPSPVVPEDFNAVPAYLVTYTNDVATGSGSSATATVTNATNRLQASATTITASVGDSATGLVTFPRPNPPPSPVKDIIGF